MIDLTNIEGKELLELCLATSERYQDSTSMINPIYFIVPRDRDFEDYFKVEVETYCKNDLYLYLYIRGIYNKFSYYYKNPTFNNPALHNKDDRSRPYKKAKDTLMELFNEYPLDVYDFPECDPDNQYDPYRWLLNTDEIKNRVIEIIDSRIHLLEVSNRDLDRRFREEAEEALGRTSLSKSNITKILAIFRKLRKDDPYFIDN